MLPEEKPVTNEKKKAVAKEPDINDYLNEKVPVFLFKDNKEYKDDYIVAVNGKVWQIQRGKTVMVPRFVAQLIDSSQRQDLYAMQLSEEMSEKSKYKN